MKGAVEIERDVFLAHGLAGMEREREKRRSREARTGSPEKRQSGRASGISPEKRLPRTSGTSPEKRLPRTSGGSPEKRVGRVSSPEKRLPGRASLGKGDGDRGVGLGIWG